MRPKIAVIGSAGGDSFKDNLGSARLVGREIAQRGGIVLTGGCMGLPNEALIEAKKYNGLTIGFSPAADHDEHISKFNFPTDADIMIYTGFGLKGRNVLNLRSCDAVISIGGRIGTLNELTIAYDEGKLIGILTNTGDLSDEFSKLFEKSKKPGARYITDNDPERLVRRIFEELNK